MALPSRTQSGTDIAYGVCPRTECGTEVACGRVEVERCEVWLAETAAEFSHTLQSVESRKRDSVAMLAQVRPLFLLLLFSFCLSVFPCFFLLIFSFC